MEQLKSPRRLGALLSIALAALVALSIATGYMLTKQRTATLRVNRAITRQHDSILLADQLRQSSDDLTRMVRSYVITGDRSFKEHFYTILDIRDGKAPRPPGYERIFWDFMVAGDMPPGEDGGEKASLRRLMEQAGFSAEELHLLTEAKRRSDDLVEIEETAIHAIEGRFRDDTGAFSVVKDPDREMAIRLLFGKEYHQAKSAIMEPIDEVLRRVDERTSTALAVAQEEQASLTSVLVFLLGSLPVVMTLFIFTGYRYHRASSDQVRRSEERFRATFDQAAVGIAHVSPTGRFLRINERFCNIVGYTRDEMLARTFQDITHPGDLDVDVEHMQQLLRGEAETYSMEKRYFRKSGERVWVNLTVSLLRDLAGDPRWFVSVVEDITRRKESEVQARAYQDRLRALAADLTITEERERRRIAGELHDGAVQSLAVARTGLDSAIKKIGAGEQAKALREVSECLRQTALDANQIASNLSSPSLNELGLAAAISEWMREQVGKRHGIKTETVNHLEEADRESLDFVARAILFRNVRELLVNVVQHAHATKVGAILRRAGDNIELVVRDDGQGCDLGDVLGGARCDGGFGLFSTRERMADLGGALRLDSEPGHGFTATLVIPIDPGRHPRKVE
jgi:PAS domain S-box-containing protein